MRRLIQAAAPSNTINATPGDAEFELMQAAASSGEGTKLRRFKMTAYNGGLLQLGWGYPVVVDLSTMQAADRVAILANHDPQSIVGHSTSVKKLVRSLSLEGEFSGVAPLVEEIVATGKNGFPWQASIGASAEKYDFVDKGRSVQVNGRTFDGPIYVARGAVLREVSFVAIGADATTSATIAAHSRGSTMNFEQWLKAKGVNIDTLTQEQLDWFKAQYDAELVANGTPTQPPAAANAQPAANTQPTQPVQASGTPTQPTQPQTVNVQAAAVIDTNALLNELRAGMVAEQARLASITRITASYPELQARAIRENWNEQRAELEVLRAERPRGPSIHVAATGVSPQSVIEASLLLSAAVPERFVRAQYGDNVMTDATNVRNRRYSIHRLLGDICAQAGRSAPIGDSEGLVQAAYEAQRMLSIRADGFSSLSLANVLGNTANKALIASYEAVETVWSSFCAVRSHANFQTHTRVRMDSTGAFKKVGNDGEVKHIGLTDSAFTSAIDTYGAIISLTRKMQVNDDLGAFLQLPQMLGRLAALRVEELVFVTLLSNPSSFFGSGNRNYASGGGSALSVTSLTTAIQKFADQVDGNGKPILVEPKVMLVPTGLYVTASNLYNDSVLIGTPASNELKPQRNPHAGLFDPKKSPYLNNTAIKDQDGTAISGQSSTGWYLFCDPNVRAAMAVAFLNGQQQPTLTQGEMDITQLGTAWRSIFDFGVGMEDPAAAVLSAGA